VLSLSTQVTPSSQLVDCWAPWPAVVQITGGADPRVAAWPMSARCRDLGPGGPPVAVRRVSATYGHARRRPTRVSARAREKSDTSLAAPSPVVPFVGSSPWARRRH